MEASVTMRAVRLMHCLRIRARHRRRRQRCCPSSRARILPSIWSNETSASPPRRRFARECCSVEELRESRRRDRWRTRSSSFGVMLSLSQHNRTPNMVAAPSAILFAASFPGATRGSTGASGISPGVSNMPTSGSRRCPRGIDNTEIIHTVHERRAPTMSANAGLRIGS